MGLDGHGGRWRAMGEMGGRWLEIDGDGWILREMDGVLHGCIDMEM